MTSTIDELVAPAGVGQARLHLKLPAAALVLAGAIYLSLVLVRDSHIAVMWLGTGVQLGILLLTPRRNWLLYLPVLLATNIVAVRLAGAPWPMAAGAGLSNVVLATLGALSLAGQADWIKGRSNALSAWTRFAVVAVLLIPAANATIGTWLVTAVLGVPTGTAVTRQAWLSWFGGDAIGMALITPALLRLNLPAATDIWRGGRLAASAILVAAAWLIAILVFRQMQVVAVFLIIPALIIVVFRVGFVGLFAAMLVAVPVALADTLAGWGPFVTMAHGDIARAVLICQLFLMLTVATAVLIGSLLDERDRLYEMSLVNADIYGMIANRSGDLIFVADGDGKVRFISPVLSEIFGVVGNRPEDFSWRRHTLAEDIPLVEKAAAELKAGAQQVECVYRGLHADGSVLWLETRMRTSQPASSAGRPWVIGSARDITRRKAYEQQLRQLASTDPLTGLANRRQFVEFRRVAWAEAAAAGKPLALLLIDVDHFKKYNDAHGHVAGDECLAAIAGLIKAVTERPGNVCARYGGEEFVVLLTETAFGEADALARQIVETVAAGRISNRDSSLGLVTVSVGFAAATPVGDDDGALFEAADKALYRAKAAGRNRAVGVDLDLPQCP